jgi:hypothetical protein
MRRESGSALVSSEGRFASALSALRALSGDAYADFCRRPSVLIAESGHILVNEAGFSFLAGALLASLADLLADGLAPSWLVRVGACLAGRFPRRNLRLCLGRRALLLKKFSRSLLAILLTPAVKETHGVIVDGRLGDLWIS